MGVASLLRVLSTATLAASALQHGLLGGGGGGGGRGAWAAAAGAPGATRHLLVSEDAEGMSTGAPWLVSAE